MTEHRRACSTLQLTVEGCEIINDVLTPQHVQQLLDVLQTLPLGDHQGGVRSIESIVPEVAALAVSEPILRIVRPHFLETPSLVRAIYFDKSAENNWLVSWHQDKTVAVSRRFDRDGWRPWSLKAGVWHVQPPAAVLERMLTVRLHLDTALEENGCLKVLPGSHASGVLSQEAVAGCIKKSSVVLCEVRAGGVCLMRPLILHASAKSYIQRPRRVLHFEYSDYGLPEGVEWAAGKVRSIDSD